MLRCQRWISWVIFILTIFGLWRFFHQKPPNPNPQSQIKPPKLSVKRCRWNDRMASLQLDRCPGPVGSGQVAEALWWLHPLRSWLFCGLIVWPWVRWPVTPCLGTALVTALLPIHTPSPGLGAWASFNQCGSGRSNRPVTAAQSSVCLGSAAVTCREQNLAGVMLLVIPELTEVVSGLSLSRCSHRGDCNVPMGWVLSKTSCGRDNLYKMLVQCLAQWRSSLSWGCRHKPNLNSNSLVYEFLGVYESVLSRSGFTFPVTCLLSWGWQAARASSSEVSFLTTGHQLHHLPSPAK